MENFKQFYINRIIDCAANNNLYEFTINKLNTMSENELISIWDNLRMSHSDLAIKSNEKTLL